MEKNTKKKEREKKQVMKGLAGMSLADLDQESSDHSSGQTKRARESSDCLSSTTNLPQKRGQHEVAHDMQGGKTKKTTAGTSTPTSYAGAVKASNQKLTSREKSHKGMVVWTTWIYVKFMDGSKDGGMNNNARMRKPWSGQNMWLRLLYHPW